MIKKIWKWILTLFQPKSHTEIEQGTPDYRQTWFEQCEPGFLVWARMPLSEEELAKIDPAHQIRPYLILAKTATELIVKACSSRPYANLREYQTVMLEKDHPLNKQTYIDLKHNYTLTAELLQNKPLPVERHNLRRIQKHLVLVFQLDHIYHPYLAVGLFWEKGDILEIDHVLWYMQEFIPGKLSLIRLYRKYRSYMEDAGWNLFFCGGRAYFTDFAHPVILQGKTRLELVHRAAAHEIEYADYCISQAKTLHIRWVPGVIMKRNTEAYIVLTRTFRGWNCLEWNHNKKKWRSKWIRDFNGMEYAGRVRRLKLRSLIASLMKVGLFQLEKMDPELLDYLGGKDQDWEMLQRKADERFLIRGINRSAA